MPKCTKKHTPIVSGKQRSLFSYWLSNPSARPASISVAEIKKHLKESEGKKLPKKIKRKK